MDWQQGTATSLPGLDPLWYLNHLHALDLARDGTKRAMAFSRWGGWGAHRYPVGFSGDSSRTWETLAFEVEVTAQSANTGFGWWSHDIGGFCDGLPDDELYLRWVQFGVLSPIFRFHNCGDPTLDYRPWTKEEKFRVPALDALRLRRALVPYLYTAARKNHLGGLPPCAPMALW
jgi:alpha-glucosidase (family GH31 glycosyl hydrolase)